MKLLNKTTLYYLFFAVLVIILSSIIQYYLVKSKVEKRVDKILVKEKKLLITQLEDSDSSGHFNLYKTEESEIARTELTGGPHDVFETILHFDSIEQEIMPYRALHSIVEVNGSFYEIIIRKPLIEAQAFIKNIIVIVTITITLLLIAFIFLNRWISRKLWSPFLEILNKLKNYDIEKGDLVKFGRSDVREFDDLSQALNQVTRKIYHDYKNQKEFVENASHELQTPLAIIRANAEMLLQAENLHEKEYKNIQAIIDTLSKLSRLNHELILLSKIEYNQFAEKKVNNFSNLLDGSFNKFEELIKLRNLSIEKHYSNDIFIEMNETLAEILITNLVKNAVVHNVNLGFIEVKLDESELIIANSGHALGVEPEKLFERFQKSSRSKSSTGLGLAIIKQICLVNNFNLQYTCHNSTHIVQVSFQ